MAMQAKIGLMTSGPMKQWQGKPLDLDGYLALVKSWGLQTLDIFPGFLNAAPAREVRRAGDLLDLTATEFELLRFLMRNPRRVLSKAQILDRVWNYDFGGQAHVVELYISYLRKKVDAGREPIIHTVRGVGYVLKTAT